VFDLEFSRSQPQAEVLGERNLLRYQPSRILLFWPPTCEPLDALSCLFAARLTAAELTLLMSPELSSRAFFKELGTVAQRCDSMTLLKEQLVGNRVERLRCAGDPPSALLQIPATLPVFIAAGAAHGDGYVELYHYLNEQAVCSSYHRYGNLTQPHGRGIEAAGPHPTQTG
jgi:hypothetical protein